MFVKYLFTVLASCALVGTGQAEVIRVGGTGSGLGTLRLIGDAFEKANPQHRIELAPSLGSAGGLKALRAGQLQLAVSNREPSADDRAAGLQSHRFASTPLAVVTHAGVPATAMTRERLAQLLNGQEARWPGGQPVRLVLRPLTDGDSKLLASLSPAVEAALRQAHTRPGMMVAQTDSEAADYIERTPFAMGLVAVGQVGSEQRKLNVLSLDGASATPAALQSNRYPMSKEMLLVMRSDASEAVRAFVNFVSDSPQAVSILSRTGHVVR